MREKGGAGRGEAEEVQRGVGVEADPAQRRVEECRGEGAREGEEAGGGGEAVEEEETGEAAEECSICSGVGRSWRGGVDAAAAEEEERQEAAAYLGETSGDGQWRSSTTQGFR